MNLRPIGLNHYATQTTDMAATHAFWTEVMGCEYVGGLRFGARTVSTGEAVPAFIHTFYALGDGSCVAFFELAETAERHDDGWPGWTRHVAFSVGDRAELVRWKAHFEQHGIPVDGEVDHGGQFYSLYVTDPNGVRVELTHQPVPFGPSDRDEGRANLESWISDKAAGRLSG